MVITGTAIASSPGATEGYSFEELYKRVSQHNYQTYTPTGDQVAECKRIANDGYKAFLSARRWSFLFVSATLSVTADDETTALPTTFENMEGNFYYAASQERLFAQQRPYGVIRELIAASAGYSNDPVLFCVEAITFVPATGQRHQVRWYPTPDDDETLYYQYEVRQPDMTDDAEYPIGGIKHSPAILASCLKQAELRKGRSKGPMHDNYAQMLAQSITRDAEIKPTNYGYMGDGHTIVSSLDRIDGPITYNT